MRYCGTLPRRFVANASTRRRFFASNGGVLASRRRSSPPRLRARRVGVRQERLAEPLLPANASARYEPSRAGATGASTLVVVRMKPEAVLLGLAGRGYLDVDAAKLLS